MALLEQQQTGITHILTHTQRSHIKINRPAAHSWSHFPLCAERSPVVLLDSEDAEIFITQTHKHTQTHTEDLNTAMMFHAVVFIFCWQNVLKCAKWHQYKWHANVVRKLLNLAIILNIFGKYSSNQCCWKSKRDRIVQHLALINEPKLTITLKLNSIQKSKLSVLKKSSKVQNYLVKNPHPI